MNMDFKQDIPQVSVRMFSGGAEGLCPGACGLFAILGNSHLSSALSAAHILQYRARNGAGIFLKGHYAHDNNYHLHVMFRNKTKIPVFEKFITTMGLTFFERQLMVKPNLYFEYDMPFYLHYTINPPSVDTILSKGGESESVHDFIRYVVNIFNTRHKDDARIFSSSSNGAAFTTAFELEDTIRIFDMHRFDDRVHSGIMIHLRWPTSQGTGLWWGAQPISHGNLTGVHNGHLSSDSSNARALEELGVAMQVGTDSEGIFEMVYWCLQQGFTMEEVEWALSQKFPNELNAMTQDQRERYKKITDDPILRHFKMSGPSTAVINFEDLMIGITDRDHMRQFTVGFNEKIAVFASEERAIVNYAELTQTPLEIVSPPAGEHVAFIGERHANRSDGYVRVHRMKKDEALSLFKEADSKNVSLRNTDQIKAAKQEMVL